MANAEQIVKAAFVIGTSHAYQRHQDEDPEREKIRIEFEKLLRRIIAERNVDLIAEEAGNKQQVHEQLKADEAMTSDFNALFARNADEPSDTIAKLIADEPLGAKYIDIRPPGAAPLPADADQVLIAERDEAMLTRLMASLGSSNSVLIICGEKHRGGLVRGLERHGFRATPQMIPETLNS